MVERDQIRTGVKLRVLRRLGRVTRGTVGCVTMMRTEQWGIPWGFTTSWQALGVKNRCSRYFTEADLDRFEILPASQPAVMEAIPAERMSLHQLPLPFTEWCLYRGNEMIDSCETW
jgi:hypothetical protein